MVDFLTKEERSARMARIRPSNTQPERRLRSELHRLGLRFRLNNRLLPGKPDLVLPKYKAVVFVHGCFWHRHAGCSIATTPKSNTDFWLAKFARNVARDKRVVGELSAIGWNVVIAWECELQSGIRAQSKAAAIATKIGKCECKGD